MTSRDDLPERVASLETALDYERADIEELRARVASLEAEAAAAPRRHFHDYGQPQSAMDTAALVKLVAAGAIVAIAVALSAVGKHEMAGAVLRAIP